MAEIVPANRLRDDCRWDTGIEAPRNAASDRSRTLIRTKQHGSRKLRTRTAAGGTISYAPVELARVSANRVPTFGAIMRLLAIGLVTAWTVTQVNPAGAQDFEERFPIIPKANASEPDAKDQPVPQSEPTTVPQTQPLNE